MLGILSTYRVDHRDNKFTNGKNLHINGIESFWSYAERNLQKFNGINKKSFNLHLKECEFRFNNRDKNIYNLFLKLLHDCPL